MSLKWQRDKKWSAAYNAPMTPAERAERFHSKPKPEPEEFPDDSDLDVLRSLGEHLDEEAGR